MASSLAGKIAFVTGGAFGIGAALTTTLTDGGAEVWIADRQIGPAQELAQSLNSRGGRAHAIELDVRNYSSFERAVAEATQQSGRIDYLFNNAGIGVRQHSGHIVNTASMAGLVAFPGEASYTASKHAVVALSKVLRLEAERHGIKVSVLCPGAIRTPILTGGKYGRTTRTGIGDDQLLKFWEPFRPMAPEKFAARALRAALRGDAIVVVPAWWKAFWYLERLSPALSMRVARLTLKRFREMEATSS